MNRAQLLNWYTTLAPRDRRVLQIGGVLALLILLVAIFLPLQTSLGAAREQLLSQQADMEWMRRFGPTLAAAGPGSMSTAEPANLAVLIDQTARESGLALALTGSQLVDKTAMRVQMEQADFNLLTGWISRLSSQHGMKVEAASITSGPTPGVVNATVQLRAR
jgi:general secretion pathway protein M